MIYFIDQSGNQLDFQVPQLTQFFSRNAILNPANFTTRAFKFLSDEVLLFGSHSKRLTSFAPDSGSQTTGNLDNRTRMTAWTTQNFWSLVCSPLRLCLHVRRQHCQRTLLKHSMEGPALHVIHEEVFKFDKLRYLLRPLPMNENFFLRESICLLGIAAACSPDNG